MYRFPGILCFLFVLSYYGVCQDPQRKRIDSLIKLLPGAREDSTKLINLVLLANDLQYRHADSCIYYAKQGAELSKRLNDQIRLADLKIVMGNACFAVGRYAEAVTASKEALTVLEKMELKTSIAENILLQKTGIAYNLIAKNLFSQGLYPEAVKYSLLSLRAREKLKDTAGILIEEYNLGLTYYCQYDYPEALVHYNTCLRYSEIRKSKLDIAYTLNAIGLVYHDMGNYPESYRYYRNALTLGLELKDKSNLLEIYAHFGPLMEKLGKSDTALQYNMEALKLAEETGNHFNIPFIYNNMAVLHMARKNYATAAQYLSQGLRLAKESDHLEYVKLSYQNLAKLDSMQGNYKKALENYRSYIFYRDSMLNKENTTKIVQTQMQYEFGKQQDSVKLVQDKKDSLAKAEVRRQRNIRNFTMVGLAAFLLFSVVVLRQRNKVKKEKKRSDELLLNILPSETAEELKATGSAAAKEFEQVTVLFTDFKNFTQASEKMMAHDLVSEIHRFFSEFDKIITKHNIEKIKTIGDSYMAAGGLPVANKTNPVDVVMAALDIIDYMEERRQQGQTTGQLSFEMRVGIHTGPVIAGIVGIKKFSYDIWGDTVNIASRMESSGEAGKVNVSGTTYEFIKDHFNCSYRGKVKAKNKGEIDMYFVSRK